MTNLCPYGDYEGPDVIAHMNAFHPAPESIPALHPDEISPGIHPSDFADYDPHESYGVTGEANVLVIRDPALAHALRIDARNGFADRLRAYGLMMTEEAEKRWYGRRDKP